MMFSKKILTTVFVALLAALVVSGCGRSEEPAPAPITNQPNPVNPTPVNPVGPGMPIPSVCIPVQSAQIPFHAQNIYVDTASIIGGRIPTTQQAVGMMTVGGATQPGPFNTLPNRSDGAISMNIVPATGNMPIPAYPQGATPWAQQFPNQGYPQPGIQSKAANATGLISISAAVVQDILSRQGGGMNYGQPYAYPGQQFPIQQPNIQTCVSGIAIDSGHYNTTIYGAKVYLYLNNTDHGYVMYF